MTIEPEKLKGMLRARKRRRVGVALGLVIALLAAGAMAAWFGLAGGPGREQGPLYKTATVTRGDLKSVVTATGTIEALNTVEVGAEISGRIEAIHVDYNDRVKRGQLLAEIDPEQYEAARAEAAARQWAARAAVAESEAAADEAKRAADRAKALHERGLLSSKELESATAAATRSAAAVESARANAALATASLAAARSRLLKTKIHSPIDGTVLLRQVEVGQTVNSSMQTPVLFAIAEDLSRMRLTARVDEADIGSVAAGQEATFTVDAYPDRTFASNVTSVRNLAQLDQNVVSYETLLSVDNSDLSLRPGMTATVNIITMQHEDVLLVPNQALRFTPPEAVEQRRFRGPPIPLMRRGKKREPNEKRQALDKLGTMDARHAVIWLLDKGRPSPVKVKKSATNGALTAVEGDELAAGAEVIIDLAPDNGSRG